jgi:hypothetical protein
MLESKLAELPPKLEAFLQNQRVLRRVELKDLLEEKFGIQGSDRRLILFFLEKFQFIRKIKRGKNVFYIIGEKKAEKEENIEINIKVMEMGIIQMIQKKETLTEEIKQNMDKIKDPSFQQKAKNLKMDCLAKARVVKSLKNKIILMQNRVTQSKNIKDDVGMADIMQKTNIDPTVYEEVQEVLQTGIDIQNEIRHHTNEISGILNNATQMDEDLEKMFNTLDNEGETDDKLEEMIQKSKIKLKDTNLDVSGVKIEDFESEQKLKNDLLMSNVEKTDTNRVFDINDVKKYHEDKFGEAIEQNENKVLANDRLLVFNNKENGLRKMDKTGASFRDYQKEKNLEEKVTRRKGIIKDGKRSDGVRYFQRNQQAEFIRKRIE